MTSVVCRIKDGIQPFERRLALEELRALADGPMHPCDGDEATASTFLLGGVVQPATLRNALAYWRSIGMEPDGLTAQVRAEATLAVTQNGESLAELCRPQHREETPRVARKRCLRYATHGLHEYRGKFFPQLVRALMNIARVPGDGIVLDPMGGSGTTLVEARLSGRTSYGLDMNPLSVFVADVKCRALTIRPASLLRAYQSLERVLTGAVASGDRPYFEQLPAGDQTYLARWFASPVLDELDIVQQAIDELRPKVLRDCYRVCLSNILRGVSLQKNDDLRVRRQAEELPTGEVIGRFLKEAMRSTKVIGAFNAQRRGERLGHHLMREGDARRAASEFPKLMGEVDTIITSPPYATALPYIDTDRLSLAYLGLLPRHVHRSRDLLMIGNREVTERRRADYWSRFLANRDSLPQATVQLVNRIHLLNQSREVGFRRRNLPALLAKYFFDMHEAVEQLYSMLRPGAFAFMVVGNNRTTAGGKPIDIKTADHLTDIATSCGFRKTGDIPMEMLSSRDIYRRNAMPSERIVALQKP